jgi:hypothetical protein
MAHGFGWFTNGSSVAPRRRGYRRAVETPKRYLKPKPWNEAELRVLAQMQAERETAARRGESMEHSLCGGK